MFAISFAVYEIFANQIKYYKFELKMKVKGKKEKMEVAPFDSI